MSKFRRQRGRSRRKNDSNDRTASVGEYLERVRRAQPNLDDQLAAYRESRRDYDAMKTGSRTEESEQAAAQQRSFS